MGMDTVTHEIGKLKLEIGRIKVPVEISTSVKRSIQMLTIVFINAAMFTPSFCSIDVETILDDSRKRNLLVSS